jgi:PAS domain S-box-containing protein
MSTSEYSLPAAAKLPDSVCAGRWLFAAMEALPHGACMVNARGTILYANERALDMLRANAESVQEGCLLHELLGAEHAVSQWLEPAVRSEHLVRVQEGEVLHARAEPMHSEDGAVEGWLLCLQRASEGDECDELRERWSLLAEQSTMGLAIVQDDRLAYCNAALAQIIGMSRQKLQDAPAEKIAPMVHPADRDFVLEQVRRKSHAESDALNHYGFRITRPSGEERYLEVSGRTVTYQGAPADLVCVTDVTGRERATQELSRCRAHLEELVTERAEQVKRAEQERFHGERAELVARLVSGVSQELRNPLGTIHTSLYALAERLRQTDTPVDDVLQRVQRSIQRCNALVEQMSQFCQPPRLIKTRTEIDGWLEQLAPVLAGDCALRLDLQSGATAALDRRRMRRALEALCENARQAMGADGELTVRSRCTGPRACVTIEDNGPGMDKETARRALEPLYSTRPTGLGLGLPLARMVAHRHGGRLSIETAEGQGTSVTMCLPVHSTEADE